VPVPETAPGAQSVAEGLFTETAEGPRLIGSRCRQCGSVTFPRQGSCPRCTSTDVEEHLLARRGELWSWTVQRFRPKTPPYAGPEADEFVPYGVGYVELPGECRVEALLSEADPEALRIGMAMEVTLLPTRRADGAEAITFGFRPLPEDEG
jgi:uncharacterized OB-fold protein